MKYFKISLFCGDCNRLSVKIVEKDDTKTTPIFVGCKHCLNGVELEYIDGDSWATKTTKGNNVRADIKSVNI